MGLADGSAQPVGRRRHDDQMHVVPHQAVRPDAVAVLAGPLDQQREVLSVVLVAEERLHAAVPALRDMVRQPRNHDSRYPRHNETLTDRTTRQHANNLVWRPPNWSRIGVPRITNYQLTGASPLFPGIENAPIRLWRSRGVGACGCTVGVYRRLRRRATRPPRASRLSVAGSGV